MQRVNRGRLSLLGIINVLVRGAVPSTPAKFAGKQRFKQKAGFAAAALGIQAKGGDSVDLTQRFAGSLEFIPGLGRIFRVKSRLLKQLGIVPQHDGGAAAGNHVLLAVILARLQHRRVHIIFQLVVHIRRKVEHQSLVG